MLANALRHNLVLEYIKIRGENTDITETGWTALSKALCDTSSINASYLSNHSLKYLDVKPWLTKDLSSRFYLNRALMLNHNNGDIAIRKILEYHKKFDMSPLFEWDWKLLPRVITWFDLAKVRIQPWFDLAVTRSRRSRNKKNILTHAKWMPYISST